MFERDLIKVNDMNSQQSKQIELGIGLIAYSIIAVSLSAVAAVAIQCCGGLNIEYSEGSRSGVIQKLSKKGVIWKTWEGELNLGYNDSRIDLEGRQTIAPAVFMFSCSSNDIAKSLTDAEQAGRRVTIGYKQYFLRGWDKGGTSYDVTKVHDGTRQ